MSHDDIGSVLDEIEEIAGADVVRALRLEFPGVRIYFGLKPDPDSTLVQTIGLHAAQALGDYFGGDHVTIPTGKASANLRAGADKARRIMALHKSGKKIAEIALAVGVTERWVYYVMRRNRRNGDDRQLDMFDNAANDNPV